jgi:hypothetical protein
MVATISATRAFFFSAGSITGDGFSEAFVDPVPGFQLAAHRRVTGGALVLGEIIAQEIDGPTIFNVAKVAGTVGEELLEVGRDALPGGGRPPRLGGVLQPWEASGPIRLEPGANRVLVAVEAPGNLRDAPALGIEQDIVAAFSEVWPSPASLF